VSRWRLSAHTLWAIEACEVGAGEVAEGWVKCDNLSRTHQYLLLIDNSRFPPPTKISSFPSHLSPAPGAGAIWNKIADLA